MEKKIVIVGCGYVGLTLGINLAAKSCDVIYIEIDEDKRTTLLNRQAHFYEEGANELLNRIYFKQPPPVFRSLAQAVEQCSLQANETIVFVTLGTPFSYETQAANTDQIDEVFRELEVEDFGDATIILRSTVSIGFTRLLTLRFPWLKNVAFCPERTVEGKALQELLELPQIVATANQNTSEDVAKVFGRLGVSCIQMSSFEAAEAVKLINNTYRDFRFAFSNIISDICQYHGISSLEVVSAGNVSYPRSDIPEPGLVGGPCLEKDPHILTTNLNTIGASLIRNSRNFNHEYPTFKLAQFNTTSGISEYSRVLVIGLAFKSAPLTDDLRGSLSLQVIANLLNLNVREQRIVGIDPCVPKIPRYPNLKIQKHINDTDLTDFSHIIVCNKYPEILLAMVDQLSILDLEVRPAVLSFVHLENFQAAGKDLVA